MEDGYLIAMRILVIEDDREAVSYVVNPGKAGHVADSAYTARHIVPLRQHAVDDQDIVFWPTFPARKRLCGAGCNATVALKDIRAR